MHKTHPKTEKKTPWLKKIIILGADYSLHSVMSYHLYINNPRNNAPAENTPGQQNINK